MNSRLIAVPVAVTFLYGSATTTSFCPSSDASIVHPDAAVAFTNVRADLSYERFTSKPATPGFDVISNDVLIVLPALPEASFIARPNPSVTGACVAGACVAGACVAGACV